MPDLALTFLYYWIPVVVLAAVLHLMGRVKLRPIWLAISIGVSAIYVATIFSGIAIPGLSALFEGSDYNWSGKILAIVSTLVLTAILVTAVPRLTWADAGLTLEQNEGSVKPSLIVILLMMVLMGGLNYAFGDGPDYSVDTLAYQATMPGFDEELMYRGVLLMTIMLAVPGISQGSEMRRMAWAGVLVTLLFTLGHSVVVEYGAVNFATAGFIITGILGGAMMWIRLRTGSVLLPIVAHNLTNVTGQLF